MASSTRLMTPYEKVRNRSKPTLRLLFLFLIFCILLGDFALCLSFDLKQVDDLPVQKPIITEPDQLPLSRSVSGRRNIHRVWLSGATDRYGHGVLGDALEASGLKVELVSGQVLSLVLPVQRVFEDVEPRLVDLDLDGKDEIVLVESDTNQGASLVIFSVKQERLVKIASTPFLGRRFRWLNPLGVGDFDGDGFDDIALVATPHIGGILRLYRFKTEILNPYAEYSGVSTHKIGSTELGLGQVIRNEPKDLILAPDQAHHVLLVLEWTTDGIVEIARFPFSARIELLRKHRKINQWLIKLIDGRVYELEIDPQAI